MAHWTHVHNALRHLPKGAWVYQHKYNTYWYIPDYAGLYKPFIDAEGLPTGGLMLWNARDGVVTLDDMTMPYAAFGRGPRTLVMLPGLSDGLATVRGKALLLASSYTDLLDDFTVYLFSRRDDLPRGHSIRDMADDQARAMEALGLSAAGVLGVSQGGMIAQYLATDHPGLVSGLVLAVTAPYANDLACENVRRWKDMANRGDHRAFMVDTAEKSYSARRLSSYRLAYPVLRLVGRPRDGYRRFLANAEAILHFDARDVLGGISCPTLVIGGADDHIVGAEASRKLHEGIRESQLHLYEGLGHAAYEEAPDFNDRIRAFLTGMC